MIHDSRSFHRPSPAAHPSRLTHALLAKAIFDALFLVALAVYFSYTNFNPFFRGSLDVADARTVEGWAVNEAAPGERVEVHLYIDGHFAGRRLADAPRADVLESGRSADAYHGFVFDTPPLPPEREYEAHVYAMYAATDGTRRTLQEIGDPKRFKVGTDGGSAATPGAWWESEGIR
ncbi:MAG TPA: hypothetical protein VJT82_05040 [Pyrinomonadaceae bacterium]|nr:hypothetical protein [Pyrinomonadaceae bacterium]